MSKLSKDLTLEIQSRYQVINFQIFILIPYQLKSSDFYSAVFFDSN